MGTVNSAPKNWNSTGKGMNELKDPALQWAADRAGLSYERFVDGLTSTTIRRIQAAHMNYFIHAEARTTDSVDPPPEPRARVLIRDAFRERIGTLPREITPEVYADLLEEIGVRSRPERELLSEIVKDEISSAHLAVTRAKLNHFLWWLGGQQ